ncbi:hypothetical protein DPMN_107736 [Dreissena polymorpha]|uniref:Uncharacterized protein n=1 Tax=Dreissena polymorpha TaxID=45954 RepID=A0A9D4K798_DREPO|nr:hypothetical protein DPMN_107736 [Dreissena polymorpha]
MIHLKGDYLFQRASLYTVSAESEYELCHAKMGLRTLTASVTPDQPAYWSSTQLGQKLTLCQ